MAKLPNLIIAGVHLSGTTSLFTYLSLHPDICPSSVKETLYFLPLRDGDPLPPVTEYSKFFSHYESQRYVLEASPGYFHGGQEIGHAIKRICGDVRILIVLREPIDRLFSNYKFLKSRLVLAEDTSFEEYVNLGGRAPDQRYAAIANSYWAIRVGFYADFLPEWFEVFGDSLRIIFFDDLVQDSRRVVRNLCEWLDISDEYIDSDELPIRHRSINYKSKFLHSVALRLDNATNHLWRTQPLWRSRTLELYYMINGLAFSSERSDAVNQRLGALYKPYNERLAAQLLARGYSNLPPWLQKSWS